MKNKNNLTGVGPDNPREDNKRARAGEDVERARSEMMATAGYEGGGRGTAENTWGYWRQEKEREWVLPAHSRWNTVLPTIWPQPTGPISHFHCTTHKTKINSVLTF